MSTGQRQVQPQQEGDIICSKHAISADCAAASGFTPGFTAASAGAACEVPGPRLYCEAAAGGRARVVGKVRACACWPAAAGRCAGAAVMGVCDARLLVRVPRTCRAAARSSSPRKGLSFSASNAPRDAPFALAPWLPAAPHGVVRFDPAATGQAGCCQGPHTGT